MALDSSIQHFYRSKGAEDYDSYRYGAPFLLNDALLLHVAALTDVGVKRKEEKGKGIPNNEDNFVVKDSFLGICDGMGGHGAGEVASEAVCAYVADVCSFIGDRMTPFFELNFLPVLKGAHERVKALQNKETDDAKKDMGSTFVGVQFHNDGSASYTNVGDSRLYRYYKDQPPKNKLLLEQLTEDHSVAWSMYKRGTLTTKEDVRLHPRKSTILNCLGGPPQMGLDIDRVNDLKTRIQPGEVYMLCSDGLWDELPEENIEAILLQGYTQFPNDDKEVAKLLVDAAKAAGGSDNITVILARVESIPALYEKAIEAWKKEDYAAFTTIFESNENLFSAPKTISGHLILGAYAEYNYNKEKAFEEYGAAWEQRMAEIQKKYSSSFLQKAAYLLEGFTFPWYRLFGKVMKEYIKNIFAKKQVGQRVIEDTEPAVEVTADGVIQASVCLEDEPALPKFSYDHGNSAVLSGDANALAKFMNDYHTELNNPNKDADKYSDSKEAFLFAADAKERKLSWVATKNYLKSLTTAKEEEQKEQYFSDALKNVISFYLDQHNNRGERKNAVEKIEALRALQGIQGTSLEDDCKKGIENIVNKAGRDVLNNLLQYEKNILDAPAVVEFQEIEKRVKDGFPELETSFISYYDELIKKANEEKDINTVRKVILHLYGSYPKNKIQDIVSWSVYDEARLRFDIGIDMGEDPEEIITDLSRFTPKEYKGGEGAVCVLLAQLYMKSGKKDDAIAALEYAIHSADFSNERYGVKQEDAIVLLKEHAPEKAAIVEGGIIKNGAARAVPAISNGRANGGAATLKTTATERTETPRKAQSLQTIKDAVYGFGAQAYKTGMYDIAKNCMDALLVLDSEDMRAQLLLGDISLVVPYNHLIHANPLVPASATIEEAMKYNHRAIYEGLEKRAQESERELEDARTRLAERENAHRVLESNYLISKGIVDGLNSTIAENEAQLTDKNNELETARNAYSALEGQYASLQTQYDAAQDTIREMRINNVPKKQEPVVTVPSLAAQHSAASPPAPLPNEILKYKSLENGRRARKGL